MAAGSSILDSVYGSYTSAGAASANARFDALFDSAAAVGSPASGLGGGYSRYRYGSSSSSPYTSTYSSSYQSRLAPLPLSSTSSSSSYSPSYDKYYTYLDDLSTLRSSSGRAHSYRPSRYLESEFLDDTRSGYGLRGSGGVTSSVGGYITNGPSHDRFGRELSNYDRWRMQNGESLVREEDPVRPSRRKFSSGRLLSKQSAGESESSSSDSGIHVPQSGGAFDAMEDLSRRTRETTVSSPISPMKSSDYNPFRESFGAAVGPRGHSMAPAAQSSSSLRYQPLGSNYRSAGYSSTSGFPAGVREKLAGYDVKDVRGDGGCYYRCLSLFFSGSEENYMRYRREVLAYIKENLENYSTMIRSETASTNDYFSRKMRSDRQDWAETTEIIATCCVYNINVHVLAIVPGRGSRATWEWLHFDPSIGTGKPSYASRDIFLYNQGSVHFMLCMPRR